MAIFSTKNVQPSFSKAEQNTAASAGVKNTHGVKPAPKFPKFYPPGPNQKEGTSDWLSQPTPCNVPRLQK